MTPQGIIAKERVLVHVGRTRLRVGSNRVQEHEAFKLIVHPEYNVNRIQHDIALIKLATDITYTDYIQPVCLWNRGEDLNAIVGTWGTVIGFRRDETGNVSNTLCEASIPVVSHITCIESNREVFAYQLTSNMLCAGKRDGISTCNGDSGGGLFFKYNDVWYIRGVVSFTKPDENTRICDTKEYTVFTDVAKYLKWIEQHKSSVRLGEYEKNSLFPDCVMVHGQKVCLPSDQLLSIETVITHPYYNNENLENNIALIRLRHRADTSQSNVKPICLAVTNKLFDFKIPFSQAFAYGTSYGRIMYDNYAEICQCTEEETTSQICAVQEFSHGNITETFGAPLQYSKDGKYILLGVLSHINPTCINPTSIPEVYTNVTNHVDWILENIQE
ncbi:CUB and peptidase domain-containing protein 1-like [Anopheles moucheti]|uniref:CUB and peptidase domain-containing protein 1-like n=1 Tax=Anopheles moucheti TaxID=186751 RepID=UPI0022F14455|nr:CUB and peptidase domain-containing protein 1-like [Anopheles moucheti]